MREIKFRAWDERIKRMLYKNFYDRNWYYHSVKCHTHKKLMPEDFSFQVLMQYTGLKDKNGIEIYEGDILEHEDDPPSGVYEGCEVTFDEEYGIYCFKNDAPNLLSSYCNLKIIGNIYENPELLEA